MNLNQKINWTEFYQALDFDALYQDLDWEPLPIGIEDKGQCLDPWKLHKNGDRTGKLAINRKKGVYNCWVCGGGTVLTLVMEVKGLNHDEGIEYLSRFIGFSEESIEEFHARISRLLNYAKTSDVPPPIFNKKIIGRWGGAYIWGEKKGIAKSIIDFFHIKFDSTHSRFTLNGTYEGPAVILPHFWQGKLVGWQERWLGDTPKWLGKYTNTSDFPRETTVWGYDFAKSQEKKIVLVESVPTALRLISEGIPAIATFGSQVTPSQCKALRIFQQGICLSRDNDTAGIKWRQMIINELERFIPLYEVDVIEGSGSDLGDYKGYIPTLFDNLKVIGPIT